MDASRKIVKVRNLKWKVRGTVGVESRDSYECFENKHKTKELKELNEVHAG